MSFIEVERREFACMAEAVSYYYKLGYATQKERLDCRILTKGHYKVEIQSIGFLLVQAVVSTSDHINIPKGH